MRRTDTKPTNYSILLICESTHTEPNFFGALIEQLKKEDIIDCEVKILPKPNIRPKDNKLYLGRGSVARKKRQPKNDTPKQREVAVTNLFPGEQPLNWVKAGIEELHIHNEVWAIFDKDGHPKTAEAFSMAEGIEVAGKKVKIAFSSRCFEYYLLLHFELIYKAFDKSECNEKKYFSDGRDSKTISFHCMTSRAVEGKACQGDKCINGYARLKGYWKDSKGTDSTFDFVRDRLWTGIYNAHAVRCKSNKLEPELPVYNRNPYVNVDKLICRLMGYLIIEHGESLLIQSGSVFFRIIREANLISLSAEKGSTIIIPIGNILVFNHHTGGSRVVNECIMLTPDSSEWSVDLQAFMRENEYCLITILTKKYYCALSPNENFLNI